jgi:hypothetical protein
MKRFSEQFYTKSKSIKLSSTEKKELQERLTSYMEYHPLPAELKSVKKTSVSSKSPILNDAFQMVSVPFSLIFKSSAVAAAFVLIVVPFMAEQSVPGDTLYAVKVHLNEEVRSTLIFDSYQKVEWETQRVNRRIAEARLLESEGRMTDEFEAEVAQAVRTHTQNAQKEIEIIRESDAEEATLASIEFDSNLEAQAASLKEDDEEAALLAEASASSATKTHTSNLIAEAVDESRALNEQPSTSTTPSYVKLMARVEQNTTRMYELSDSLKSLKPETKEDVARRILDIDRSVNEAIEQSVDNEPLARETLVDVLKRTQKLIVFMTDLEVSDTVDIEELVPVVLTDKEESEKTIDYKAQIEKKEEQLKISLGQLGQLEIGVTQKVELGLKQIADLSTQSEEVTDFSDQQPILEATIEILDDLILLAEKIAKDDQAVIVVEDEIEVPEIVEASSTATTSADLVEENPVTAPLATSSDAVGSTSVVEIQ